LQTAISYLEVLTHFYETYIVRTATYYLENTNTQIQNNTTRKSRNRDISEKILGDRIVRKTILSKGRKAQTEQGEAEKKTHCVFLLNDFGMDAKRRLVSEAGLRSETSRVVSGFRRYIPIPLLID